MILCKSKAEFVNKMFTEFFKSELEDHNLKFDELNNQIMKQNEPEGEVRESFSCLRRLFCGCFRNTQPDYDAQLNRSANIEQNEGASDELASIKMFKYVRELTQRDHEEGDASENHDNPLSQS